MSKPEFHYSDFEDYLFMAIQLSRELTADNCVDYDDVLRQLSLAKGEVEMFLNRVNKYHAEKPQQIDSEPIVE